MCSACDLVQAPSIQHRLICDLPLQLAGALCQPSHFSPCLCSSWDLEVCLVYTIQPLGGNNSLAWYDDSSSQGLVAALGIGIKLRCM